MVRGNRLDVEDSAEEVLNDLGLALLASFLDTLDLSLGILVSLGLGLLVALAVLHGRQRSSRRCRTNAPTSASNFLYSSSFLDL